MTEMRLIAPSSPALLQSPDHELCPGCGHPVAWRQVLEVLEELGVADRTIIVVGHGCYTQMMRLSDLDSLQCLHGRGPAVATGVKRMLPESVVITLSGDGDMVSEGLAEVLHTAGRSERITSLLFNNGVFGDTGGHMTAATVVDYVVDELRAEGMRIGSFRPVTLWPFPGRAFAEATRTSRRILVYELNAGQMLDDVRIHAVDRSAIRFIGGVSQDSSGMRQGDLLDAAVLRSRVLTALEEAS